MTEKTNEDLGKFKENEINIKSYGWGIRHIQICMLSMSTFMLFMARSCMGIAVLAMTAQNKTIGQEDVTTFDWDKRTQSYILSSFFWGYMVMQIPGGLFAKRFGGKPVVLVSLLLNAALNAALPTMAYIGGWPAVCAARVMMGLSQACLFPSAHTFVGRWMPAHEMTTASGFTTGGAKVGIIVGLPLYGFLAYTDMGWPIMFYTNAALITLTAVVWWIFAASTPGEHSWIKIEEKEYIERGLKKTSRDNRRIPWCAILRNKHFWGIQVAHIGFIIFFSFMFSEMPTYFERGIGISLKNSATLSALPYVAMTFMSFLAVTLSDKLVNSGYMSVTTVRRLSNSLAFMGVATGLVAMCFTGPENGQLAIIITIFACSWEGFISSGFIINHLDLSRNFGGVTLSMTNTVGNLFTTITPIITSFILRNDPTDISRWHVVFLTTAATAVLCNTIYVVLASGKRQPYDDPDYFEDDKYDTEELKAALNKKEKEQEKEDKKPSEDNQRRHSTN